MDFIVMVRCGVFLKFKVEQILLVHELLLFFVIVVLSNTLVQAHVQQFVQTLLRSGVFNLNARDLLVMVLGFAVMSLTKLCNQSGLHILRYLLKRVQNIVYRLQKQCFGDIYSLTDAFGVRAGIVDIRKAAFLALDFRTH